MTGHTQGGYSSGSERPFHTRVAYSQTTSCWDYDSVRLCSAWLRTPSHIHQWGVQEPKQIFYTSLRAYLLVSSPRYLSTGLPLFSFFSKSHLFFPFLVISSLHFFCSFFCIY
ncbi:hypothetical protein ACSS6W_010070 [Trichoderma asperelloides]